MSQVNCKSSIQDQNGNIIEAKKIPQAVEVPEDFTVKLLSLCKRIPCCGIILSLLSSIFYGIANLMVKFTPNINPFVIVIITLGINFIFYIPFTLYLRLNLLGVSGERFALFMRSLCGFLTLVLSYLSFRMIPLSDALTIISAAPVFVSIFGWMILKEECGIFQAFTISLTLVGVLLISKPTFIFASMGKAGDFSMSERTEGSVIALISCITAACVYIALRKLPKTPALVVINSYAIACVTGSLIASCILVFIFPNSVYADGISLPSTWDEVGWLLLNGLAVVVAQISLTVALKVEEAGLVALTRTADIVFAFIFQICFLSNETIEVTSYIGAVIIFISVWLTATRRLLASKPNKFNGLWRVINCGINRPRQPIV